MNLAQSLGVRLEIVKTSWSTLKSDLETNSFDIAMGGITITLDRQKMGLFSNPVFSSGKTPITHCGDEPKYETIAAIDQPGVHVIVNPGGTNERFDRAHLQKATIIQWSDNATIFDALVEGKADLMITDAVETRVQAKLHPGILCPVHPNAPFDHSELAYWMPRDPIIRGLRQSMAEPSRSLGRASGDPRPMDALMQLRRAQKGTRPLLAANRRNLLTVARTRARPRWCLRLAKHGSARRRCPSVASR